VLTDTLTIKAGEEVEARYGIVRHATLETALECRPDAVLVTNPSSLHVPVALAAARAGCHLFIEKPLSHDLEGIEALVSAVDKSGLVALVGYQFRFHPCWLKVKELLDAEVLGPLMAARFEIGEYLPAWHTYEDYRTMYASRRDLGGGVVLSQIHEFDLAYWLFGMPEKAFSIGGRFSRLELDVEDTASTLFQFKHRARALPVHIHQDYFQRPARRRADIIAENGRIRVDLATPEVRLIRADGTVEVHAVPQFARNQLFLDEMRHFLECVAGRARPAVGIRDGLCSLKMALAALQSMRTGQACEIA
jgi:predicted dehydrogenase